MRVFSIITIWYKGKTGRGSISNKNYQVKYKKRKYYYPKYIKIGFLMFVHGQITNSRASNKKKGISSEALTDFAYAEFSSAIEMLHAAKLTESRGLAKGFLNHCLDEYRHTSFFLKVVKEKSSTSYFQPRFTIARGFIDGEYFLFEKMNLRAFAAFVAVNEQEARKLFTKLSSDIGDIEPETNKELNQIIADEVEHEKTAQNLNSDFKALLLDEERHARLSFGFLDKLGRPFSNAVLAKKYFVTNKIRHLVARKMFLKTVLENFFMFFAIMLIFPFSKVFNIRPLNNNEIYKSKNASSMI